MRTWERLRKTKAWIEREICVGKDFKIPKNNAMDGYGPDIYDFTRGDPSVFLAWYPMRPDNPGSPVSTDPYNVAPAITIMPTQGYVRYLEEKRFDRYSNINRPQDMGQSLGMQFLLSIYEPGIRLPGFEEGMKSGKPNMALLKDGTEAGLEQLVNWMDDLMELVLRERNVPGTDLILDDDNAVYSLYTDQNYIVDRRPYYYGFVNIMWRCYANDGNDHGYKSRASRLLDD